MNSVLFYKAMSGFYDLLDVIYFRKYDTSPRKVVNEAIKDYDKILDLCTGTGTNAVNIAKADGNSGKVKFYFCHTKIFSKFECNYNLSIFKFTIRCNCNIMLIYRNVLLKYLPICTIMRLYIPFPCI